MRSFPGRLAWASGKCDKASDAPTKWHRHTGQTSDPARQGSKHGWSYFRNRTGSKAGRLGSSCPHQAEHRQAMKGRNSLVVAEALEVERKNRMIQRRVSCPAKRSQGVT